MKHQIRKVTIRKDSFNWVAAQFKKSSQLGAILLRAILAGHNINKKRKIPVVTESERPDNIPTTGIRNKTDFIALFILFI